MNHSKGLSNALQLFVIALVTVTLAYAAKTLFFPDQNSRASFQVSGDSRDMAAASVDAGTHETGASTTGASKRQSAERSSASPFLTSSEPGKSEMMGNRRSATDPGTNSLGSVQTGTHPATHSLIISGTSATIESDSANVQDIVPPTTTEFNSLVTQGAASDIDTDLYETPENSLDALQKGELSILGRVLDPNGRPVPGITLVAVWMHLFNVPLYEQNKIPRPERELRTQSDFDGYYSFWDLADGEYRIHTTGMDGFELTGIAVRAGVDSADLVVAERSLNKQVYGAVRDVNGAPLEGVKVMAVSQPGATYTDKEGNYSLFVLAKGRLRNYDLLLRHANYKPETVQIPAREFDEFQELRLDAVMEPITQTSVVTGTITTAYGAPLAGEKVKLSSHSLKRNYTAITRQSGSFRIPGVVVGNDYRVQVYPNGFRGHFEQNLRVQPSGLNLDIELEPLGAGTLTGQMMDPEGNPIPNFSLWLRSRDDTSRSMQVTGDSEGYFVVENAPDGRLSLDTRSYPRFGIVGIHLTAGEEKYVDAVLDWGPHQIYGRVLDSSGRPVSGSDIILIWTLRENGLQLSSTRRAIADAQGNFSFTGLAAGPHKILINHADGFEHFDQTYEVGLDTAMIMVELQRSIH